MLPVCIIQETPERRATFRLGSAAKGGRITRFEPPSRDNRENTVNIVTSPPSYSGENTVKDELLKRFAQIVGEKYALTDPAMQEPYLREMRDLYQAHTPMVLRPGSVAEVSACLLYTSPSPRDS